MRRRAREIEMTGSLDGLTKRAYALIQIALEEKYDRLPSGGDKNLCGDLIDIVERHKHEAQR
jgi:hypothetical protein